MSSSPSDITVVDPSGNLLAFLRTDDAILASIDISMKKAKTVALFNGKYTTAELYPLAQPGASLYGIEETNGGLVVFGGGVPVFADGFFVGAVGVSGGTVAQVRSVKSKVGFLLLTLRQDESIATAGADAVGSTTA